MTNPTPESVEQEAIRLYVGWVNSTDNASKAHRLDVWREAFYEGAQWALQYWQNSLKETQQQETTS